MSDVPLSKHFFYFLAQNDVPSDYKPVLQVVQARKTRNGLRLKMFDGFFHSNACYIHNADLVASLPDFDNFNPIVRVLSYEGQDTGVAITSDMNGGRPVLNILEMQILDFNADAAGLNLDYPLTELAPYADYMANEILEPQTPENEIKPTPAKRARIAPNPIQKPSAATTTATSNANQSVPKISRPPPSRSTFQQQRSTDSLNGGGDQNITPVAMITPFLNKWRICGYCTLKSIRQVMSAQKGPMKVLEFHLSDETGKTVKMTAWNEQADEVDAIVIDGQMYYVSGDQGCIRKKNIRFNFTDSDYEISLNRNCQVAACNDRIYDPPKFSIKRKFISDLSTADEMVDILAVIDKIGDKANVLVKTKNQEVAKRDITLVDESLTAIALTVWDEKAQDDFVGQLGDVIGIKNAKIKEFNGSISLSLVQHSTIEVHPEVPGMNELHAWYEQERPTAQIKSLSVGGGSTANFAADFRSLAALKNSAMIESIPHGIYVYSKCEILEVRKDNAYYPACVKCNKKVVNSDAGLRCDKCNITNPEHKMRYMLNVNLNDGLDTTYVTLFDEQAMTLLGVSAEQLDEIRSRDENEYNAYFEPMLFQSCVLRMKVVNDYYNDQKKMKFTVYQVKPVPYPQYEACLDAVLEKLENL
uniref:Replication protein A subunit n=1 Tax=Panagrolaimus sp. ES5 TaxID=591445 RepID=A0AC34F1Q4_9BILA